MRGLFLGREKAYSIRWKGVRKVAVAAYVLIGTAPGKETAVLKAVEGVRGVTSAEGVTGPYDIIARVEGSDAKALGTTIMTKIRSLAGVTSTLTCVVVG